MNKKSRKPGRAAETKKEDGAPKPGTASLVKAKRHLQLHEFLDELRAHAEAASAAGSPSGACLVPNSQTGGHDCVFTDEDTCTSKLKGVWIGGPCGPD